ncbi:DUF2590 family protein [Escherichia coli]|uniref:DUF2590 family protein n=1 Tax=Escherichia coli TaxID=562 RepID=UPI000BE5F203|nr:DUF2590 family protein [Escherichia coli]EEV5604862.1 DUF2590 family protein [Escherichia coli]EEZ5625183.1 DUF2590 family protein [Escherichia coli]EEZ6711642.1 DUF2590 family protein [Escherichia coli]EFC1488520.1 DUF2590 family protein [Escherichia coli]EFD0857936.1 DUF2590 family protein [Escherichia coli]
MPGEKHLYVDLLITGRNFTLNSAREPVTCDNRASIAQDCQHAIIESGLATQLLAEKSPTLRADIIMQMILLLEDDERIIPGTVSITGEDSLSGRLMIRADTEESHDTLVFEVTLND